MDLTGVPTPVMNWDSANLLETFKKFRQHVELIFLGALKDKEEEVKVTYLLLWIGEKGREIYNTLTLTADECKSVKQICQAFEKHVQPKSNPVFSRYKFNNEMQGGSSIEQFLTKLKVLAKDCAFGADYAEDMIRDRLVFGVRSHKIREKLLTVGADLTLQKAVEICQSYEYAQEQLRSMHPQGAASSTVAHVKKSGWKGEQRKKTAKGDNQKKKERDTQNHDQRTCRYCGKCHEKGQCPAKGKQCRSCKKWNHFATVCMRAKRVNEVDQNDSESESSDVFIDSVNSQKENKSQIFSEIEVGPKNKKISFKADTGSQVNILPLYFFQEIGVSAALIPSKTKFTAYDGSSLKVLGTIKLHCSCTKTSHADQVEFFVVDTKSPPLFGLQSCIDFGLLKITFAVDCSTELTKNSVMQEIPQVFKGIGSVAGECSIQLKPDAIPVVHPPHKIPVALRDRCKKELDRIEKLGVIARVNEPTEWVNSMVVVEKKLGQLRICLDPHDLNKYIQRPHHPIKTLEDVLSELSGAKYFTKLDARSAYWALHLDQKSSYLTCFNTVHGRYRYLRLAMGLKNSMDLFQRKIDEIFQGLTGVIAIVDDIIVYGRTRSEHDANLRACLQRSLEKGIRINEEKMEVGVQEIGYFGHILSADGLKPDPAKISAVKDMPAPENKSELQTVLGMVNYLSKFAPNLAKVTEPLRKLLNKDVEFYWGKSQSDAFSKVKQIITQEHGQVLGYYDPAKPLTLQTDSSRSGLGATLLQEGKPIAYASKSLTSSEKSYAQIELECLAILFGLKHYHHWIYGRHVVVETDHLPLIPIFKKPFHSAPARLQGMLLQMQGYDIQVSFLPGRNIPIPDTLSRKSVSNVYPDLADTADIQVNLVISSLPVSDRKLQEIRLHTANDEQLSLLGQVILDGWPVYRKQCPDSIIDFWNYRDELTCHDGLIMKGQKLIIPKALRSDILELVHIGHKGVEKTLRRARNIVFWPRISQEITELVLNCPVCLERRCSNQKEPLVTPEVPSYPMQLVGTDLFTWDNRRFLVVADYYSHYFEVKELPNIKSQTVINKMKGIFARMGIPEVVLSDNGGCYASEEFAKFSKEWDFVHQTSSPYHSSRNGFAESYVKICKQMFSKAKTAKQDALLALLEYRATPLNIGYSPAELLMGRQLRSILPTSQENLLPRNISHNIIKQKQQANKQKVKAYFDKGTKSLPPLELGDSARVQNQNKTWKPAQVVQKHHGRSYTVCTEDGSEYRRNRTHLMKTNECIQEIPDLDIINTESDTKQDFWDSQQLISDKNVKPQISGNTVPEKSQSPVDITRSGRAVKPKVIKSM